MRDAEGQSRMSNLPLRGEDGEKENIKEFFFQNREGYLSCPE